MAQTQQVRTGSNLFTLNPTINTATGWNLTGFGALATYDASTTHTADGSGSLKLARVLNGIPVASTGFVAVAPSTPYTFACYMKCDGTAPALLTLYAIYYDAGFNEIATWRTTEHMNSDVGIWEEAIHLFATPNNCAHVTLNFGRWQAGSDWHFHPVDDPNGAYYEQGEIAPPYSAQTAGNVWADDIYLGTGYGFNEAPAVRTAFTGVNIKVDSEGNWERWNGAAWVDFYPVMIYTDYQIRPLTEYASHGFNTIIWDYGQTEVAAAKAAGLYSMIHLAPYLNGFTDKHVTGSLANTLAEVDTTLAGILAGSDDDNIVGFYHDNEINWAQWQDDWKSVVDRVRSWSTTNYGGHLAPVYALQGQFGAARAFRSTGWPVNLQDVVGTYATATPAASGNAGGHDQGMRTLFNQENQILPCTIIQCNGTPDMRLAWYRFTIQGGKGIAYYADNLPGNINNGGDIANQSWWANFATLVTEITVTLLPFIKADNWTTWSVGTATSVLDVEFCTRDIAGVGHIMLVNLSATVQVVTFGIANLGYTAGIVRNFFDDTSITTVEAEVFTLTIPAPTDDEGTMVVYLEAIDPGSPGDAPVLIINDPYFVNNNEYTDVVTSAQDPNGDIDYVTYGSTTNALRLGITDNCNIDI